MKTKNNLVILFIVIVSISLCIYVYTAVKNRNAPITEEPFESVTVATDVTGPTEVPHKHSYDTTIITPSCNDQGYTLYSCECGDSYKDDAKNKLNHNYSSEIIAPSTESPGYTLYMPLFIA